MLVSEDVLPEFRPFYALHEIIETTELAGKKERCLEALKIELSQVPSEIYLQYTLARMLFFMRLIDFHELNAGVDDDLQEMRASLDYLTGLKK